MSDTILEAPKKRGRPTKFGSDRTRGPFTVRFRDVVRDDMSKVAAKNGRSLSEEVEHRIELSLLQSQILLRDWFAGQALNGMAQSAGFQGAPWEKLAKDSYLAADAMLAERAKEQP